MEDSGYRFYGWEQANVSPVSDDYPGIREYKEYREEEILRLREEGLFTPFRPDYLRLLFRLREHGDVMEPESI